MWLATAPTTAVSPTCYTANSQPWNSVVGKPVWPRCSRCSTDKCSALAETGDRLATIDIGRKLGAVPLLGGGAGSPCNTMRSGPRPEAYLRTKCQASWSIQPFSHNEIWGGRAPWGGAGSASNTMLPGPRPITIVPSGISSSKICHLIHPAVWPQLKHGPKLRGCVPFVGRGIGSPSSTMWPGPRSTSIASSLASSYIQLFGHKAHNRGLCLLFRMGELSPNLTQCRLGRGLPPYQVASWSIQPFGHNRLGPKIGGLCPF